MLHAHPRLAEWLELLERRHAQAIDLGLDRCGRVYERLGSPHPGARVITVAGTNGKGSAVAWLHGLLMALGYSTAAYTSPHLLSFNERLALNGVPADSTGLIEAFEAVEAARDGISLTYYEFTTLACLWMMRRMAPDFALLEVGLGGRLDTVNLVDADLALIMPIGLDHQEYLGRDRERIGLEKAGVMRPHRPVVCGEPEPPASVLERARSLDCPLCLPGRDFRHQVAEGAVTFIMGQAKWVLPAPPLRGAHQPANLAAALAAVATLCPPATIRQDALREGVRNVRLPGRLQELHADPRVIMDVGHNPLAAEVVAEHLVMNDRNDCHCVLGMLNDKDAEGVARVLGEVVAHWHCAPLPGERGQSGKALAARITKALGETKVDAHGSVESALQSARRAAGDAGTVLVFGSFRTVASVLRVMDGGDY